MYKHRPTTPDWLYHPANILPELVPELSKELLALYQHVATQSNSLNLTSFLISFESKEFHNKTCPTVMFMLSQLKIQDFFQYFCFITKSPNMDANAHIDGNYDFGLNIPVLNCHDSYTVWYDSKPLDYITPPEAKHNFEDTPSRICHTEDMKEIGRCSANTPHWINTNVPHQPVVMHDQFRVNASLRFDNELLIDRQLPYWVYKK